MRKSRERRTRRVASPGRFRATTPIPGTVQSTHRPLTMTDWREYQEEVAEFFRSAGWSVDVEAEVRGVRTRHAIDVWALTQHVGIVVHWAIECKDWNRRVPKEKVLALRTIVDDIGADRGLILNELGFQKGAKEAAAGANITVTTLDALRSNAEEELVVLKLSALHRRAVDLSVRISRLSVHRRYEGGGTSRTRRGIRDAQGLLGYLGAASHDRGQPRPCAHRPLSCPDARHRARRVRPRRQQSGRGRAGDA